MATIKQTPSKSKPTVLATRQIQTTVKVFRQMASHHHHQPTTATTSYCHCCYAAYSACYHHPPPPPDSHLLFHLPRQPHLYPAQTNLPDLHQYHPHFQERSFQEERQTHPSVSSLLRRIAALESALRSRSSSHSLRDAAARTIQTHFRAFLLRRSRTLRQLKDLAYIKSALSILKSSVSEKAHFDYDVVYHKAVDLLLKLDTIQGGDPMIRDGKSSIRRELTKFLDFIDGCCVERRGLSSGVNLRYGRNTVKSRVNSERKMENLKYGGLKRVNVEKLRGLVERIDKLAEELDEEESEVIDSPNVFIRKHGVSGDRTGGLVKRHGGVQPKVKKSVSFAENGKVYRVLRRNDEPFLEEDCDDSVDRNNLVDPDRELEDDPFRVVEEIGASLKEAEDDDEVEAHSENGGSLLSNDGEKDSRSYLRSEDNLERRRHGQGETANFTFSAPLPPKMETRDDLIEKRKKIAK